jgi:hypothetical protein
MRHIVSVLVVLLALPAAPRAEDKPKDSPKDKPPTPAQQYQALVKEYEEARKLYEAALEKAKTPEQQQKIMLEKNPAPRLAPKLVALAEKSPKDPAALDALIWVLTGDLGPVGENDVRARAGDLLIRDHLQSEKLDRVCESLRYGFDMSAEKVLRAVLAKNPHKRVQAQACLALAQYLGQRATIVSMLADNPRLSKQIEGYLGKKTLEELKKTDLDALEKESVKVFGELASKYVADMAAERLKGLCQELAMSGHPGSESFMRTLLDKDGRRDVQGMACLALGQLLKQRADKAADKDLKDSARIRRESEKLLDRAAAKYADVKLPFRGTVGDKARSELYEIRHLAVGLPAPEIAGADQDGKNLKLSDYKGKVVLLDFWSQY